MVPKLVNIWPKKCPHCGADLTKKNSLKKYSVDSVQWFSVDPKTRMMTGQSVQPTAPTITLCRSCETRLDFKIGLLDEQGEIEAIGEDENSSESGND